MSVRKSVRPVIDRLLYKMGMISMEAEKGTRAEASPNSLRSLAEHGTSTLRRSHLRSFAELTPTLRRSHLRSFAEPSSDASPKSPPKLRRTQLRYFAEVTSEASPNPDPILRRSHLRSFAEVTSMHLRSFADASPNSAPILRRSHLRSFAELSHKLRQSIHYKDTFQVVLALLRTTVYRRT